MFKSIKRIIQAPIVKRQVDKDLAIIKRVRSYDNAPDSANNGEAGHLRSLRRDIEEKYKKPRIY